MMTIQKFSFVTLLVVMFFIGAFSITTSAFAQTTGGGGTGCSGCGSGGVGEGGGSDTPDGGGHYEPTPVPTCILYARPSTITAGGSSVLSWTSTNATAVGTISQGVGDVNPRNVDGRRTVSPTTNTTYTLTVRNAAGVSATCSRTITVTPVVVVPAPTCVIAPTPASVVSGGASTLTWTTTNAASAAINQGIGAVAVGANKTRVVNPTATTTYTMTVVNSAGVSRTCAAVVKVTPKVIPVPAPTCVIAPTPASIVAGRTSTLTWTTTNAASAAINQGIGAVAVGVNKTQVVAPTATTTYTMTVVNSAGVAATCKAQVKVVPPAPSAPRCENFDAAPLTINRGQNTVLSWNTTNASAAAIDRGIGSVAVDGNMTVSPLETTTYTMTLVGANNQTAICKRQVTVIQPTNDAPRCEYFNASATTIDRGDSTTLSWDTTNATAVVINPSVGSVANDGSTSVSPSETTTYTLTVTGTNNQTTSCTRTIDVDDNDDNGGSSGGSSSPKCTLKISDTKISRGDRITIEWETSYATEVMLKDSYGKTLVTTEDKISSDKRDLYDGEIVLRPEQDTTYTLYAERGSKDRTCKVSVDVEGGVTVLEVRDQKPVVTGIALTQVPYTGFEAGPFLTMVFYGLLLLWALYLAYVLVVRKNGGNGMVFATATPAPVAPIVPAAAASFVAAEITTPRFVAPVAEEVAAVATPVVGYAAAATSVTTDATYEAVAEMVEKAAHAERVLISSEAMRHFVSVTTEELRAGMLAAVLEKAKASYPSEDGWVVLNIDRMKSVTSVIAPAVSVFTPRTVNA